ncbi:RagB/SusD family nutrient uptake outer membrane protein [Flavobacterium gelidilacus]
MISVLTLLAFLGCDEFVTVDTPNSQLTGSAVFEDSNTANAAMAAIYAKLRDDGFLSGSAGGSTAVLGMYVDELVYYGGTDENIFPFFSNNLLATNALVSQQWNTSYHQIYCANAVIEGCENSTALSNADKNQFIGEALFVRALVHGYLVGVYGDVPYIISTDYATNRLEERMPVADVFEMMINDLERAVTLLPDAYVSPERVRPNRSTASALLARMYMYAGQWAEASNAASAVINNSLYTWEDDIDAVFLKESSTTIWQFSPKLEGNNTDEGELFIFESGPPPYIGLSSELFNSFATNDLRKTHWVAAISDGTTTWYHAHKYKQQSNTGTSLEYSIIFRLSEQYLIRAEARARQGELSSAKEDLNKVRQLAGLASTTAVTADEIVAAVMLERRHELFTEYGHRFFDLKRNGFINTVLPQVKPGWNTTDQFWPLPENELLVNPNLTQNPGY